MPTDASYAGMTNLPALAGRALATELSTAAGAGVSIENDARAALLGEQRFGAARGVGNVLMLTLGTGIGGALLLDGRLRHGPHRLSGEIGLSPTPRDDGTGWTALEDVASPGGLLRTAGIDLAQRVVSGDPDVARLLDRIAEHLAAAIVDAHVLLDLELVLLAGGMTRAGPALLDRVQQAVPRPRAARIPRQSRHRLWNARRVGRRHGCGGTRTRPG